MFKPLKDDNNFWQTLALLFAMYFIFFSFSHLFQGFNHQDWLGFAISGGIVGITTAVVWLTEHKKQ